MLSLELLRLPKLLPSLILALGFRQWECTKDLCCRCVLDGDAYLPSIDLPPLPPYTMSRLNLLFPFTGTLKHILATLPSMKISSKRQELRIWSHMHAIPVSSYCFETIYFCYTKIHNRYKIQSKHTPFILLALCKQSA